MRPNRGFTLVEVLVVITIIAVLLALAAPTFGRWLNDLRIRGTAEAMLGGLQFARSEATARNSPVRFQLTDSLDASCALTTTGLHFVVDAVTTDADDGVAGQCNAAPSDTLAPHILRVRSASEVGSGVAAELTGAPPAGSLIFNGLGRLTPQPAGTVMLKITGADTSNCRDTGGELTCLNIQISPTGQVRMCNPMYPSGDPQAC